VEEKKHFIIGYSNNDSDTDFYSVTKENIEQLMVENN